MFINGRGAVAFKPTELCPATAGRRRAGWRSGWRCGRSLALLATLAAASGLALGVLTGPAAFAGQETQAESLVVANSCAAGCRKKHNQCRIRTKGASSCDAQLNACLQECLKR